MNAPGARSKLAVVVSIDLAGYAAMTETDQQAAVAEAAGLRRQVDGLARAHDGRLFHAAGDGFMAEFGSASAALAFARELGAAAHAPVRIGVHLGEVAETPEGDLLGHGVNVAARLQARARPGQALISADVRRALPGGHAEGLKRVGVIRLDKMSQRIETFALGAGQPAPRRRTARLWPWAAVAAALALAAVLAWPLAWSRLGPADRGLVALTAFDTSNAPAAPPGFAGDLRDELVGELTRNDLGVVAQGASRAAFLVSGAVRQDAGALRVEVRLDDRKSGVALWSNRFEAPSRETTELRQQVAVNVADAVKCASSPAMKTADVETLRLYLMTCDRRTGEGLSAVEAMRRQQVLIRLVERKPDFAPARALLAIMRAYAAGNAEPEDAPALREEARREAQRALAIDPKSGKAYLALTLLVPVRQWGRRDVWLEKAVALDPSDPDAQGALGNVFSETGRMDEAAAARARSVSLDPLSPGRTVAMAYAQANEGAQAAAEATAARATAAWPAYRGAWQARVRILTWGGRFEAAQALLAQRASFPGLEERELADWRAVVEAWSRAAALPQGPARAPYVAKLREIADHRGLVRPDALQALAAVAEPGLTLQVAEHHLAEPGSNTLPLFNPPFRRVHRDPRFMGLAAKLGLAQYWLESGRFPDFCADDDLPYACRAEAERAVKAPGANGLSGVETWPAPMVKG